MTKVLEQQLIRPGSAADLARESASRAPCREHLNQEREGEKMKCLKLQETTFEIACLVLYHFFRLFVHSLL